MINKCVQKDEPNVHLTGRRKGPNYNLAFLKEKQNDKTNNSRPTQLQQSNYWL